MIENHTAKDKGVIFSVQACRGVSAILVVFFHNSTAIFGAPKYWGEKPFGRIFDFGHAGVDFFFVLSGLIILRAHWNEIGNPRAIPKYLTKRALRIYPIYWFVLFLVIFILFLSPEFRVSQQLNPVQLFSTFSLLAISDKSYIPESLVLSVSWTLFHEILFYVVFLTFIIRAWVGFAFFAVWMLATIIIWPEHDGQILGFYLSPLHILFAMGMTTYCVARSKVRIFPWALAIIGTAIFIGAGAEEILFKIMRSNERSMIYGLGSSMVLCGLIRLEFLNLIRVPRILKNIGDASYSIYLVHLPLLSGLAKFSMKINFIHNLPLQILFVSMAVIAILAGMFVHSFIEKPLIRILRNHLSARPSLSLASVENQ